MIYLHKIRVQAYPFFPENFLASRMLSYHNFLLNVYKNI
ncbi:hypothetical protein B4064_1529 [Caldibacillus thermoamylovorans]|nr:hypothetical protein B4064_1529 [Caldibacillus thermoamylovorans]